MPFRRSLLFNLGLRSFSLKRNNMSDHSQHLTLILAQAQVSRSYTQPLAASSPSDAALCSKISLKAPHNPIMQISAYFSGRLITSQDSASYVIFEKRRTGLSSPLPPHRTHLSFLFISSGVSSLNVIALAGWHLLAIKTKKYGGMGAAGVLITVLPPLRASMWFALVDAPQPHQRQIAMSSACMRG